MAAIREELKMSDNVVKLRGEAPASGPEAVAKVVAWLRDQADAIENGEARPVHKAILVVFEDCSGTIRTNAVFCNTSAVERAGILCMALNDIVNSD